MFFIVNLSVLSDSNKRLLYDVGVYDSDEDENVRLDAAQLFAVLSNLIQLFWLNFNLIAGHGGFSWRDGANDEPNEAKCE